MITTSVSFNSFCYFFVTLNYAVRQNFQYFCNCFTYKNILCNLLSDYRIISVTVCVASKNIIQLIIYVVVIYTIYRFLALNLIEITIFLSMQQYYLLLFFYLLFTAITCDIKEEIKRLEAQSAIFKCLTIYNYGTKKTSQASNITLIGKLLQMYIK